MIWGVDQLATRERQAGPFGMAERLVVPMKPGNSGGGKEPQSKGNEEATKDHELAHGVRRISTRGLGFIVWFGFRNGLPSGRNGEKGSPLLPPRYRTEDISFDYRHYASKLQASSVFDDRGTGRICSKQSIGFIDVKVETPQFLPARTVDTSSSVDGTHGYNLDHRVADFLAGQSSAPDFCAPQVIVSSNRRLRVWATPPVKSQASTFAIWLGPALFGPYEADGEVTSSKEEVS